MVDGMSFFSFGMLAGIVFTLIFIMGLKIFDGIEDRSDSDNSNVSDRMDRGHNRDNKE